MESVCGQQSEKDNKSHHKIGITWKYVPSDLNLAALGSRGATIAKMERGHWLTGPNWLLDEMKWPQQPQLKCTEVADEECRPTPEGIHLEVTRTQTADEFQKKLNALFSRRTRPRVIISDNAGVFKTTVDWIRAIRLSEKMQNDLARELLGEEGSMRD